MKKLANVGFKMAVNKIGVEKTAEVLGITTDAVYRIKRGENTLKLEYAAKMHDVTQVGWARFKEWE